MLVLRARGAVGGGARLQAVHQQQGGGDVRDGGGREETAASSGDDRSVRERRSVVRRRRTTGENNDVGGEGKHAAQVHLTALLPQPCEVEKVSKRRCEHKQAFPSLDTTGVNRCVSYYRSL